MTYSAYSSVISATTDPLTHFSPDLPGQMHCFVLAPEVIFQARVNMSSVTYPIDAITYDTVTHGTYSDVLPGMTVVFGDSALAENYGRQRIRKAPTSSVLYIGRSSEGEHFGEVNISDNLYITVWNLREVWSKIPYINSIGVAFKDSDLAVGTYTTNIPPVANTGPGFAATIDRTTNTITCTFDGTNSFATVEGASITGYLWDVDDGTITVGSDTDDTITATFPAGFRYISLTVTDSNSQTHTAYCPVYARDYYPNVDTSVGTFEITNHKITPQGQEISIRIREALASSSYPDGTLVMVWEGEPSGPTDRSHMVFVGWHHTDPASITAGRTANLMDTTLNCLDVAGKLATLPGFPQTVERNATPSFWTQMADTTMFRYLHYLLLWHSTALEVADWQYHGATDNYPFVVLSSDGASLWDQVSRRAKSLIPDYMMTCNTLGQLATISDPMLQPTSSRITTVQAALDESDWIDIKYTHQRPPRVNWLRSNAILSSASTISSLFCVAPGESPAQGELSQEQGEKLAISQQALNDCEGHRYARLNAPNGTFTITLATGDDHDIEPAALTWVTLTIGSAYAAQRGLNFTAANGLVSEINISYDHNRTGLVKTVQIIWEKETSGWPAVTSVVDPNAAPAPEFLLPSVGYTLASPTGLGTVYAMSGKKLQRTRSLAAGSPTWEDITPAGLTSGNPLYDFALDYYSPTTTGYLAGRDGVYKCTNLDGTPTWSHIITDSDINGYCGESIATLGWGKLLVSPVKKDWVAFFWGFDTHTDVIGIISTNAGSTWTAATVLSGSSYRPTTPGCIDVVPHLIGGYLYLYAADSGSGIILKSTNNGATWTTVGTMPAAPTSPGLVRCLHCPYDGNGDGNIFYATATKHSTDYGMVLKFTDGGVAAVTEMTQVAAGTELITDLKNRDFSSASDWTGSNWSESSNTLLHSAGSTAAATLTNAHLTPGGIVSGVDYLISYDIVGRTAGDVTPAIGAVSGGAQHTVGTHTQTITAAANNADISFTPSSDFDGAIDNISVSLKYSYGSGPKRGGIESYLQDGDKLIYWSERLSNEIEKLWKSTDGGATWTKADATGLGITSNEWVMASARFQYDPNIIYVLTNKHVYVSTDGGVNFSNKSGDISLNSSGNDFEYLENYGNAVIVSLWVE